MTHPPLKTILVAEDDADDRAIFQMAIEQLDCAAEYQIRFAGDGKQLLQLVEESRPLPVLVFLDLNMPIHDGKECLAELRTMAGADELPVIILSTSNSPRDIEETYQLGANLYVQKPNSFERVVDVLDQCLCADYVASARPDRGQYVVSNR